jgi:hypothetical protein
MNRGEVRYRRLVSSQSSTTHTAKTKVGSEPLKSVYTGGLLVSLILSIIVGLAWCFQVFVEDAFYKYSLHGLEGGLLLCISSVSCYQVYSAYRKDEKKAFNDRRLYSVYACCAIGIAWCAWIPSIMTEVSAFHWIPSCTTTVVSLGFYTFQLV